MKRVAIVQSNYIPWKGYFDMIAFVDEFVLFDSVQFTKNDWRNRNRIKTPRGMEWLTVPVGQDIRRLIREVRIQDRHWQGRHWKTLCQNYSKAAHFRSFAAEMEPLYLRHTYSYLSDLNRVLIEFVCKYLGIRTRISDAGSYELIDGKTTRLASICKQAGATEYVSGPAAMDYIDEAVFAEQGIGITWFDYEGYPEYPQLWGGFEHGVSVLDLLFNCGKDAPSYMRYVSHE